MGSALAYRWAKVGNPILIGSRNLEQSSLTDQQINVRLGIKALEDITILQSVAQIKIVVATTVPLMPCRLLIADRTLQEAVSSSEKSKRLEEIP